ncbi:Cytohesin-1 [Salmo salar]|uniref:Cytohesin-1 n=1 Tax=Salmo salar TaxID=8030 RepID=B5XC16_SALSA|nr:Cytohesin-1 [Salmo salar]ACI68386.1 Cytohesin-1 [Salmo salar]|eukprot:NP_001134658.1 Cytohesin-1 [Salmo salar]
MVLKSEDGVVPDDLTPEEQHELENIRRRKQELLEDIQRLKNEIAEVTSEIENLGSTEERKNMQRNKQVAMGRKKFNMDPKKGIKFLIENLPWHLVFIVSLEYIGYRVPRGVILI